jgi:hypothetical protein
MNCDECRDIMLEADPATLTGRGEGGLAEHLRSCLTCRRSAAAIVRDTRMLAGVVERRRRAWRGPAVVAGLAAAALLLGIGLQGRRHAPSQTAAAPVQRATGSAPAVRPVDTSSRFAVAPSERAASTRAPAPVRPPRAPRRPIRAVAYQPTPFVATPIQVTAEASEPMPMVSVRPPAGRRAAVFRTPSPGVTIVWLY